MRIWLIHFRDFLQRGLLILFHLPPAICMSSPPAGVPPLSPSSWRTQASQFPHAPIYGGSNKVKSVTEIVKDADAFTIGSLEVK